MHLLKFLFLCCVLFINRHPIGRDIFHEGKCDVSAENLQTAAKLTKNNMPNSLVDECLRLVSGTALFRH